MKSLEDYNDNDIITDPKVLDAEKNMKYYSELSNEAIKKFSNEIQNLRNEYGVELESK
ncbi:hypothetical protein D3C77_752970 [compost metagenome]